MISKEKMEQNEISKRKMEEALRGGWMIAEHMSGRHHYISQVSPLA